MMKCVCFIYVENTTTPSLYNWDRFAVVEVVDYGIY